MVKYIIPGFYEHADINLKLIDLMKTNPEIFNDNTEIHASYGNFQHCIFDGGRIFPDLVQASKEVVDNIILDYNKRGIKVRYVFTNNQLKETDYYDRFANIILEEGNNGMNEIVIADSGLENYIREHYNNYNFISSTTKCLTNPQDLKKELDKDNYYMVCLDYNLNHNKKLLESLSNEQKNKCEFLVNAICVSGCPNRKEHYRLNSISNLQYGRKYQMEECNIRYSGIHPKVLSQPNNITVNEIYNYYEPLGFSYFKIEGRTWSDMDLILTYANFMVKPDQQLYFISLF